MMSERHRPPLLGCIADDLTGATDLAGTLAGEGMRVVQLLGVPDQPVQALPPADAVVVALKTRSIAAADAVNQSVRTLRWLIETGCRTVFFKYCSTFDSTETGNIGPVADAILAELGETFTVVSPAFPRNGRTVYLGHLFVGEDLLADSGMRNHPINPMTDSSLLRLLRRQTDGRVGLVPYATVDQGAEAIRRRLATLRADGTRYAVVDALHDEHLAELARACPTARIATGGSALAGALAAHLRRTGAFEAAAPDAGGPPSAGYAAVIAGSCSTATLAQIDEMRRTYPAITVDPARLAAGHDVVAETLAWAAPRMPDGPVLIYSSAPPEQAARTRQALGEHNGELIERTLGQIAHGLRRHGLTRLVVAGGETSGAIASALSVRSLVVGAEIEPGVPVTWSTSPPALGLVLKSGNFGSRTFFRSALRSLGVPA